MSLFFYKLLQILPAPIVRKTARKRVHLSCFAVVVCIWAGPGNAALDRVGDFALLDSDGEFHQLSRYRHRQALVMMAYDAACPDMGDKLARYQALAARYGGEDMEFLLLDSLDLGRPALRQYELELPLLEDDGQLVSESLGISRAGEVLVLNPERLSLFYRGPLAAQLEHALAGVIGGSLNDTVTGAGSGCDIDYPVKAAHTESPPDYATQVAPVIIDNCAECHRRGGVGPFALDSYIMVLGWSPMIREVVLNKRMPPTQVDPYIGHSGSARYLSTTEMQTLIHWIDAGAPQGSGVNDPLEQLAIEAAADDWQLGEPDFVVTAPANEVPPTGIMDYLYDTVELPFNEDRWIRAIEYRAGDASVLHHLMTFVTAPDEDFWGPERRQESTARRFVGGYVPGKSNVREFPQGTGVLIPQGHGLSMQFHYVTNGQATVDETRLGLYFSDATDLREQRVQAVSARFLLPPNVADYPLRAEHVFSENVVITGVRARMNYRGKKMKFAVEQADGSLKEIFSVPAYNYGWQPHYILRQPEFVPAGGRVYVIGAFDNSLSNPTNPNPDAEVRFGLESWEEMFTGYFTFHRSPD